MAKRKSLYRVSTGVSGARSRVASTTYTPVSVAKVGNMAKPGLKCRPQQQVEERSEYLLTNNSRCGREFHGVSGARPGCGK